MIHSIYMYIYIYIYHDATICIYYKTRSQKTVRFSKTPTSPRLSHYNIYNIILLYLRIVIIPMCVYGIIVNAVYAAIINIMLQSGHTITRITARCHVIYYYNSGRVETNKNRDGGGGLKKTSARYNIIL